MAVLKRFAVAVAKQANTSLCMQLDHDADNHVIESACTGASYQEWEPRRPQPVPQRVGSGRVPDHPRCWRRSLCRDSARLVPGPRPSML